MGNTDILEAVNRRQHLKTLIKEAEEELKRLDAQIIPEIPDSGLFIGPWCVKRQTKTTTTADKVAMQAAGIWNQYSKTTVGKPFLLVR